MENKSDMDYISGNDRNQMQFFALEEMVTADSWARVIDMFVDLLPLNELGFKHASIKKEGRPPYDPSLLLKLYLYGYKHAIRSTRKLEHACKVNIELWYLHQRIALHKRSYKKHGYSTQFDHMPDAHKNFRHQMGWDKDYFLQQALKIGPSAHDYIQRMLESRAITEQTYNGCLGVLRLSKNYPPSRVEAACKRALLSQSTSYKTICNILSNNLDLQDSATQQLSFSIPSHENLRGSDAYN